MLRKRQDTSKRNGPDDESDSVFVLAILVSLPSSPDVFPMCTTRMKMVKTMKWK